VGRHGDTTVQVEAVVRLVAAVTVAAYAIGLFTANAYLQRIGVADFAQLRARFVFTGVIVLVAFLVAFLPVLEWRRRGGWYRGFAAAWVLVGVLGWWVMVSLTKGGVDDDDGFGNSELRHAGMLELGMLMAGATGAWLMAWFWDRRRDDPGPETRPTRRLARLSAALTRVRLMATAAVLLAGAALFISQFGRHVYPRIPPQYGGGKAVCGRLALSEGVEEELRELRLPSSTLRVTRPVPIAYEADTFLVIGLGDDTWLRVRNELIDAVQLLPDSTRCRRS